ncbi:hypothetical protein CR513_56398, partial [Mucuna pruriens]
PKFKKDEKDKVLQDIKDRWNSYFHRLFNEGCLILLYFDRLNAVERSTKIIPSIEFEVKEVLDRMDAGKVVGWIDLGEKGIGWLINLFNVIIRFKIMLDEQRSTLMPIYKNKVDIQNCANYKGVKLMNHTLKLWDRIIVSGYMPKL